MEWIFVVVAINATPVGPQAYTPELERNLTLEQCVGLLEATKPISRLLGAACIGPDGEILGYPDVGSGQGEDG